MKGVGTITNEVLRNKFNDFNFGSASMAVNDWRFAREVFKLFSDAKVRSMIIITSTAKKKESYYKIQKRDSL